MQVDSNLDFDFLISTISQRLDFANFEFTNMRIHDRNIAVIFSIDLKVVSPVEGKNLGERNLMEFGENHHISGIRFCLPIQLDSIRLKKWKIR